MNKLLNAFLILFICFCCYVIVGSIITYGQLQTKEYLIESPKITRYVKSFSIDSNKILISEGYYEQNIWTFSTDYKEARIVIKDSYTIRDLKCNCPIASSSR
jgi:hypothetical protein